MKTLLTTLLLAASVTMAQANDRVAVATLFWEPYITTNLPTGGPATEIVTRAFKTGGLQADVTHMPWKDVMTQSQAGVYHAIYPAYFSLERMEKYLISEPFLCSPVVLVARAGSTITYTGLKSLKPYRIGVVAGYANAEAFDDADYLNKTVTKSDFDSLQRLKQGELDLVTLDKLVAISLIRNHADAFGSMEEYRFLSPPLGNRDMYVMFPKTLSESEVRLKAFNKGLKLLKADGEVEKIIQKSGFR